MTTIGAHNTGDDRGRPTAFADLLFFTEALPDAVRRVLGPLGYEVAPCRQQSDLVIAWRRGTFAARSKHYKLAHPGIAKVTPHRGTYWIHGHLNGEQAVLVVEHRINAAFPPFKRGERFYRPLMWKRHTALTLRQIRRFKKSGVLVVAAGDLNAPDHSVSGYRGELHEAGSHFDRIGSTRPLKDVEILSRMGSDHPRLRATLVERP